MTCGCGSRRDNVQSKFSPITPHFFKIILVETIENKKFQIPMKFLRKYGGTLSSQVFLKLPCGLGWKLGLTKSDGKVWIDKDWTKFADYYSLGRGDLLVFRYVGNSHFHVIILDTSTMEIDYPFNPNHFEKHDIDKKSHEFVKESIEDDVSIEVLDSFSPSRKTRDKSPLPCSRPHKKMKTSPLGKTESDLSHLRSKVKLDWPNKKDGNKSIPPRRMKPLTVYGKTLALERASSFQSENPFFTVTMQASYTSGQKHFHVPYKFAKTYINKKECEASLWVSDGKSWSVQFKVRFNGRSPGAEFCRGWKEFVLDNGLKAGDICTFELTNRNNFSFRVSIVKIADDAYNHLDKSRKLISEENISGQVTERPSSSGVSKASKAASHFFSTNPFFQVAMRSVHMWHCTVHVPRTFSKRYFEENAQTVTLWVGKRSWHVKLLAYPSQYKFSAGWAAFARENSLQPRDVCIFELIKRNQLELKVSIFRESGLARD